MNRLALLGSLAALSGCTLYGCPVPAQNYLDDPCALEGTWTLTHHRIGLGQDCTPPTTLTLTATDAGCIEQTLSGFPPPFESRAPFTAPARCRGVPVTCDAALTFAAADFDARAGATQRIEVQVHLRQLSDGRLGGTTVMSLTGCNQEADQAFDTFGVR